MRPLRPTALLAPLLVLGAALWLGGCDPVDNSGFTSELNDPNYVRGGQLQRTGRNQEALSAYLKVVDRRGGDAPEAHLQAGVLYLQHIKDPVAAIHHFNRYLELKPNSPQADLVRQLIDTGKKDFAKTLPAAPFEGQVQRIELREAVERLQKENFQLKEEIARLRGLPPAVRPSPETVRETATPLQQVPVDDPEPAVVPANNPPARPLIETPRRPAQNSPTNPQTVPPSGGGRTHTVQKGDTLWNISMKYYGNGRRRADIVAANPGVLQDENSPLKIGTQIRIP